MSNSIACQGRQIGFVDAATYYTWITGNGISNTIEARAEIPVRDSGSFTNLYCYVPTNTASVTSVITLRKSTADTALTVSYTSDQTGAKEDTTHSVSYANTDEVDVSVVIPSEAGTNTLTMSVLSVTFAPDTTTNCITFFAAAGLTNYSSASANLHLSPTGSVGTTSNEAKTKYRCRFAFTLSNFYAYLATNSRLTDTIYVTRKNGADGAQTFTYTSAQTGAKEDTTHTDTLAVGDDLNYRITTSTGTDTAALSEISARAVSTVNIWAFLAGIVTDATVGPSVTTYYPPAGGMVSTSTTEADEQILPRFDFTASELGVMVSANTNAVLSCVVTVRDDGADSGMSVSYAAAQTGLKNDSVNTSAITGGSDEIDYKIVNSDVAGTVTFNWIGMLGTTVDAAGQPTVKRMGGVEFAHRLGRGQW